MLDAPEAIQDAVGMIRQGKEERNQLGQASKNKDTTILEKDGRISALETRLVNHNSIVDQLRLAKTSLLQKDKQINDQNTTIADRDKTITDLQRKVGEQTDSIRGHRNILLVWKGLIQVGSNRQA